MRNFQHIAIGAVGLVVLGTPLAFASAASVSVQSLTPGPSVVAKTVVTFQIVPAGFSAQSYQLSDSFPASTASVNNVDPGGKFSWVPAASDVGTHTFTITALNYSGDSASTTQTITVLPPPSLTIQSVSPSTVIMPDTKFTFSVAAPGFTSPNFIVSDNFSGSTVSNVSIDTSGNFSWTPDVSQNGEHVITIYASDSRGSNASVSQTVQVGAGPSLSVQLLSPGASVPVGTTTSFMVIPANFSPTSFSVGDNFPGTSVSNANITSSGNFLWIPTASDVGVHILTITGVVGAFGKSATMTQTITVLGPGGALPPPSAVIAPTSSTTSNTLLSSLQAQLAGLVAQISAQSSTAGSGTASSGFVFKVYLRPGMQGDDVTRLQTILAEQGFFSGTPSGYYGPVTTDAVVKFQAKHGLQQLGVVGPATRAALNALQSAPKTPVIGTSSDGNRYVFKNFMGFGWDVSDGPDVMELQKRLITLGFFTGEATGYFGSATEAAVKKFQSANGLRAVGYVGADTRAALNK